MSGPTPFHGRRDTTPLPTRTLYRFEKQGGHWAEICERKVTPFRAIEFIVFVDGSLLESQMFHSGREAHYPDAINARVKQFTDDGWQLVRAPDDPAV